MKELLNQRINILIADYQDLIRTASAQHTINIYTEIQERYQLISDILEDPECEMNEAFFYGILDLISVNRKQKEEIYLMDKNAQC